MSQYNPKFFSRDHISSISEALNQVLNGGTNQTSTTQLNEWHGGWEGRTDKPKPGEPLEWRPGVTDVKDVDDFDLKNYARMPGEYGDRATKATEELARRKVVTDSGKLQYRGLEYGDTNDENLTGIMKKHVKHKGLFDKGRGPKDDKDQSPEYIQARNELERRSAARVTARVRDSAGKSDADAAAPAPTKRSSSGPTPQSVVPGRGGVPTDAVFYHPVNNPQGVPGDGAGGHGYKHGPKRLDVEIPKPLNSSPNTSGVKGVRPHYQPGVPDSVQPSALPFHPLKNPDGDKKKVAGRDYTEGPMSLTNQDNRKKSPQRPMGVEPMPIEESLVEAIRNLIRRNYR